MVNYYRLIIDFYILYNAQELIFVSFFFFFWLYDNNFSYYNKLEIFTNKSCTSLLLIYKSTVQNLYIYIQLKFLYIFH